MQADSHLPTSSVSTRSSGSVAAFSHFRFPGPRRKSFALKALPAAAALLFSPAGWTIDIVGGAGLPQNGTVFSGAASGSVAGNQLTINQSTGRAVVDWASFNIDAGKAVQILQPNAASAMLNRVTGDANPSQILGSLSANGTVMLMNPNGVMFGQNATVNVGSLIATTGNIDVNNFINTGGAQIMGAAGSITNQGSITAQGAGLVALVAPSVTNQGSIIATGGTIALAGSTAATVSLNGGLYEFAIPTGATGASVSNTAGASLDGSTLRLAVGDAANLLSGVINLEGVQQASNAIVVNGHTVVLKSALQAPNVSGNASQVDVYSGARIQDAVNIAKTGSAGAGAAVDVHAGNYAEQVALDKANLTLTGLAGAKIVVPDTTGQLNGISITANNVTVTGMEIAGPVNQPYTSYAWGSGITRGIAVLNGVTGFTISNNNIHDVRNGILIDGRNTGSVTGNRIENTKSAISVQYTDASDITIAGNSQGPVGNEWGLNLHLNGYVHGANIDSNPIGAAPTLDWQQSLLALSAGNGGWSVQDQGYTSSNRTHVAVATTGSGSAQGSLLAPLDTLQGGVDAVVTGGTVNVAGGTYVQPVTLRVNKSLTLTGAGQGATVIDARGVSGYGINVTADNVSLKDFTLYGPSADMASAYGIKVAPTGGASARLHNFSISNVTSRGAGRAELDLNGVDGALIDHVTADGAPVGNNAGSTEGAGIQLSDSANVTITNSTTRNNAWGGLALYQANRSYNQQMNNITVAGNNSFTERNPVYLQDESASRDFGTLNIAGFDFAVRNASTAGDNNQYTWLQASQQNAYDYAVNLGSASSSYIQGWNGAQATQNFYVGIGNLPGGGTQAMSVSNTLGNAGSGANIYVGAGAYAENLVVSNPFNLFFNGVTLHSLALNAGAGGSGISGTVTADAAGGIVFNAPVSLLGDTTLATLGADITLNGDIQNAGGTARALSLLAGSGATRGNVHMVSGGTEASALGQLAVVSNAFSLDSTLWVKGYGIDALGSVALSNHTLRGQDASATNTLNAGGDVTGSTISLGAVEITSGGDVAANVTASEVAVAAVGDVTGTTTSQGNVQVSSSTGDVTGSISGNNVVVQAQGDVNVVVVATGSASLAGDSVVANVVAPVVEVAAVGDAQLSGSSSHVTMNAASGSVSGNFGQVTNSGGGLVNVNGKPQSNQQLSSNAENNRVIPSGNNLGEGSPAEGPVLQLAQAGMLTGEGEPLMVRRSPSGAGEAIDNGQAVELDMSPKNEGEKE
jgi:filamentous hemagglutinin family protein